MKNEFLSIPAHSSPVSVFRFVDARDFLREAYRVEKARNPSFSQRFIARMMHAGSSSFFQEILNGKARLTPSRAFGFARLFRLPEPETAYFENLAAYAESKTDEERHHVRERLKLLAPPGIFPFSGEAERVPAEQA